MGSAQETQRLHLLNLYHIMDTSAEQAFDNLTSLAADICDVPVSLVSMVDAERQWFKSRHGLQIQETPRDISFCTHTIEKNDVFIVEDASRDTRFATNPLVVGDPGIRFYAGVPLTVSEGANLGTLCVIDYKAREFNEHQQRQLKKLASAVVTVLELRRAQQLLKDVKGLIPMCAWCGDIQTDNNQGEQWQSLKQYVETLGKVSHGICPDCHSKAASEV